MTGLPPFGERDQALLDAATGIARRLGTVGQPVVDGTTPTVRERAASDAATLRLQRCTRCQAVRYPTAPVCPECLSMENEWVDDAGRATLWSFCIYHRAYDPAFRAAVPYNVALVELEAGPRLISNVLRVEPEALTVGLPFVSVTIALINGRTDVLFVPDDPDDTRKAT